MSQPSSELLLAIKKLLEEHINGCSFQSTMDQFLDVIMQTTQSDRAFIGMYKLKNNLRSFTTTALSKPNQSKDLKDLYKLHYAQGLTLEQLKQYVGPIDIAEGPINIDETISESVSSYAGVPIERSGETIGYVGVLNKNDGYGAQDFKVLGLMKESLFAIINAHRKQENNEAHNKSENRHALVMEESEMGFWEWNNDEFDSDWQNTQQEWWSPKFYELLGYEDKEIPSNLNTFVSLIHPDDREITFEKFSSRDIGKDYDQYDIKHRLRCKNGEFHWFRSKGKIYKNESKVIKMVGSIRDIHREYKLMQSLNYKTTHDDLTGLPNRQSFISTISKLIQQHKNTTHVVAIVDIEHLSVINDVHGSDVGDHAIKYVAKFIKERLRKKDIIARVGADEFGIVIKDCTVNEATIVLNSIVANLDMENTSILEHEIKIGLSIGASVIDSSIDSHEQPIAQAYTACKHAKENGSKTIKTYNVLDSEIRDHQDKINWVSRVRSAFKEKKIRLFAQPIVKVSSQKNMAQNSIRHFEVLTRMEEEGKFISPSEFMPTVEGFRLSSEYDCYLINQFCAWYKTSSDNIPRDTRFSINLSGQSMTDKRVLELIIRNIKAYHIPPEILCLEITETAAINNMTHAKKFIDSLRNQGLSFSLDDFGQGLSSFSYLKELPVDFLKIDGQFIKNLKRNSKDYSIVNSINQVGKTIGYSTVAECVEDEETLEIIRELGIDFVQGYLFGKPVPIETIFEKYLRRDESPYLYAVK